MALIGYALWRLEQLVAMERKTIVTAIAPLSPLTVLTRPTPIQQ